MGVGMGTGEGSLRVNDSIGRCGMLVDVIVKYRNAIHCISWIACVMSRTHCVDLNSLLLMRILQKFE